MILSFQSVSFMVEKLRYPWSVVLVWNCYNRQFGSNFHHCIIVEVREELCNSDRLKASPYYALINRARGPYEEIFVLTFKAYGLNEVRSMRLECQNKYFRYGPKSWLIRALLYTYTNKIVSDEILLSKSVVYCVSALPGPYAGPYPCVRTASQPIRSKNSFRISVSIYNK